MSAQIQGQDIILLLGRTGAGKSTLIHFLSGSKLEKQKIEGMTHIAPVDVEDKILLQVKTSPHKRSQTRHIHAVSLKYQDVGIEKEGVIILCDTPGFEDTAGAEMDIANSIAMIETVKLAKSVRPVVLFSREGGVGDKGELLKETTHLLVKIVLNVRNHLNSFSFVFTKHTDEQLLQVNAILKNIKENFLPEETSNRAFMGLFDAMLEATEERALGFNPLEGGAKKLLKTLNRVDPINEPSKVFSFSASKRSKQLLSEQLSLYQKNIEKAVEENQVELIQMKLDELLKLKEVLSWDIVGECYDACVCCVKSKIQQIYKEAQILLSQLSASTSYLKKYQELYEKLLAYRSIESNHFACNISSVQLIQVTIQAFTFQQERGLVFNQDFLVNYKNSLDIFQQIGAYIDEVKQVYLFEKNKLQQQIKSLLLSLMDRINFYTKQINTVNFRLVLEDLRNINNLFILFQSHLDLKISKEIADKTSEAFIILMTSFELYLSQFISIDVGINAEVATNLREIYAAKTDLLRFNCLGSNVVVDNYEKLNRRLGQFYQTIEDIVFSRGTQRPSENLILFIKNTLNGFSLLSNIPEVSVESKLVLNRMSLEINRFLNKSISLVKEGIRDLSPVKVRGRIIYPWLSEIKILIDYQSLAVWNSTVLDDVFAGIIHKCNQYVCPIKEANKTILDEQEIDVAIWIYHLSQQFQVLENPVLSSYGIEVCCWIESHLDQYTAAVNRNFQIDRFELSYYSYLEKCYQQYINQINMESSDLTNHLLQAQGYANIDELQSAVDRCVSENILIGVDLVESSREYQLLLLKQNKLKDIFEGYCDILPANSIFFPIWYLFAIPAVYFNLWDDIWLEAKNFLHEHGYESSELLQQDFNDTTSRLDIADQNIVRLKQNFERNKQLLLSLNKLNKSYQAVKKRNIKKHLKNLSNTLCLCSIPSQVGVITKIKGLVFSLNLLDQDYKDGALNLRMLLRLWNSLRVYKEIPLFYCRFEELDKLIRQALTCYAKKIEEIINMFLLNYSQHNLETLRFILPLLKEYLSLLALLNVDYLQFSQFFTKDYLAKIIEQLKYGNLLFSEEICKFQSLGNLKYCFEKIEILALMQQLDVYLEKNIFRSLYRSHNSSLYGYIKKLLESAKSFLKNHDYIEIREIFNELITVKQESFVKSFFDDFKELLARHIQKLCNEMSEELILMSPSIDHDQQKKIIFYFRKLQEIRELLGYVIDDSLNIAIEKGLESVRKRFIDVVSKLLLLIDEDLKGNNFEMVDKNVSIIKRLKESCVQFLTATQLERIEQFPIYIETRLQTLVSFYLQLPLKEYPKYPLKNLYRQMQPLIYSDQLIYRVTWLSIKDQVIKAFSHELNSENNVDEKEINLLQRVFNSLPANISDHLSADFQLYVDHFSENFSQNNTLKLR